MLDHHRHASETPFKWRFAGGPMMACWWPALSGIWILPSLINSENKNVVKVGPSLTKLSGSAIFFIFLFKIQQEDWNNYRLYSVWRYNPAGTSSRHAEVCCNVFTIKTGCAHICWQSLTDGVSKQSKSDKNNSMHNQWCTTKAKRGSAEALR